MTINEFTIMTGLNILAIKWAITSLCFWSGLRSPVLS